MSSDSDSPPSKIKSTSRINIPTDSNIKVNKSPENLSVKPPPQKTQVSKNKPELTRDSISSQQVKKPKLVPMDGLDLLTNPKKVNNDTSSASEIQSDSDSDSDYSFDDTDYIQPESSPKKSMSDTESVHSDTSSMSSASSRSSRSSDSSGSSASSDSSKHEEKTYEEIQAEKQKLLWELEKYERRLKIKLPRRFTMASNIDEIKHELKKLKHQYGVEKGIRFLRQGLKMFVSGAEKLNNRFDPIGAKLDGWTEAVEENIEDYDEVFEELHDKYEDSISMPPELRLAMMVAGSGFALHMSKTLFKTPGLEEIMRNNPALKRQIEEEAMKSVHEQNKNDPFFNMMMGAKPQQRPPPPPQPSSQFNRPTPPPQQFQRPQQMPQPQFTAQQPRPSQPSSSQPSSQNQQRRPQFRGQPTKGINIDV